MNAVAITSSGGRFLRTLLLFALAGPIIGGVVSNLVAFFGFFVPTLIGMHGSGNAFSVLRAAAVILLVGLLYSVVFAIIPSIVSGFAIAMWEYMRGRIAFWLAAMIGVLAGIVSVPVYWLFIRWSPEISSSFDAGEVLAIIAGSVGAAVCCWWLMRPRTRAAP